MPEEPRRKKNYELTKQNKKVHAPHLSGTKARQTMQAEGKECRKYKCGPRIKLKTLEEGCVCVCGSASTAAATVIGDEQERGRTLEGGVKRQGVGSTSPWQLLDPLLVCGCERVFVIFHCVPDLQDAFFFNGRAQKLRYDCCKT